MTLARMVSTMANPAEEWNCSVSIERRFCLNVTPCSGYLDYPFQNERFGHDSFTYFTSYRYFVDKGLLTLAEQICAISFSVTDSAPFCQQRMGFPESTKYRYCGLHND